MGFIVKSKLLPKNNEVRFGDAHSKPFQGPIKDKKAFLLF